MTEKRGRLQNFLEFVNNKQNAKPEYTEDPLSASMVRSESDKKLKDRLDEYQKAMELLKGKIEATTTKEYCIEVLDIIQLLHITVSRVAGVFATAGDKNNNDSKKLMSAWDKLTSNRIGDANFALRFWGSDEPMEEGGINSINVMNLHQSLYLFYFPDAFDVINFCWKRLDIAPQYVTVLPPPPMMTPGMGEGGQTLTSSGGRTSEDHMQHPNYDPVPRRMPNKS